MVRGRGGLAGGDGLAEGLVEIERRGETGGGELVEAGGRVADIAGAFGGVDNGRGGAGEAEDEPGEIEDREGAAAGDVEDAGEGRFHGKEGVGAGNVMDGDEIAGLGAVAINGDRLVAQGAVDEDGDGGGVGAGRVLAGTEDVEVTEGDGGEAAGIGKEAGSSIRRRVW